MERRRKADVIICYNMWCGVVQGSVVLDRCESACERGLWWNLGSCTNKRKKTKGRDSDGGG